MGSTRSRERVARNFVERYGADRFRILLDALTSGASGQAIAEMFDVSRERVRQWKNMFGTVVTLYQVHPEILSMLEAPPPAPQAPVTSHRRQGVWIELDDDH